MKILFITVGKPKKDFENLFLEYVKRIKKFSKIDIWNIKESIYTEDKVISKIKNNDFFVVLDEKGKEFFSKEFAIFLEKKINNSVERIVFLIGPPDGHSEKIREKSDFLMSFSKLTFPHDLAMVILAETVYRSLSIINNHPYHRQ